LFSTENVTGAVIPRRKISRSVEDASLQHSRERHWKTDCSFKVAGILRLNAERIVRLNAEKEILT
jgi:hypothetical protein